MYHIPTSYPYPYMVNPQMYNMYPYLFWLNSQMYNAYPYGSLNNRPMYASNYNQQYTQNQQYIQLKDYGPNPFVIDIDDATSQNNTFRTALWTGNNLQLTLMSINVGEDIGLEMHPTTDQFIRIEEGQGIVRMGDSQDNLNFERRVDDDSAIIVPAGKWHNIINTGNEPLKVYSVYAPPKHPFGTVHNTKSDAQHSEQNPRY